MLRSMSSTSPLMWKIVTRSGASIEYLPAPRSARLGWNSVHSKSHGAHSVEHGRPRGAQDVPDTQIRSILRDHDVRVRNPLHIPERRRLRAQRAAAPRNDARASHRHSDRQTASDQRQHAWHSHSKRWRHARAVVEQRRALLLLDVVPARMELHRPGCVRRKGCAARAARQALRLRSAAWRASGSE